MGMLVERVNDEEHCIYLTLNDPAGYSNIASHRTRGWTLDLQADLLNQQFACAGSDDEPVLV